MSKALDHRVVWGALLLAACGGGEMNAQMGSATGDSGSTAPSTTGTAGAAAGAKAPSTGAAGTATAGAKAPSTGAAGTAAAGAKAAASSGGTPSAGAGAPAASSSNAGGAGAGGMSGSTGGEPTFTNVYNALFSVSGIGGCYGCHGGLANPALNGNFAMLSDQATTYKALVSAPSSEASVCKDMTRVTPGDPMKSLLYLKLSSMQPCGMPMPPGTPLAPETVKLIEAWIAAGAKDD